MNNYAIYINGNHVDTITAYNTDGAIAHYIDDHPDQDSDALVVFEIILP